MGIERPSLPRLDPLEAAQEAAAKAQKGNVKLSRSVDVLRTTLETIAVAEMDHETGKPVSAPELRALAVAGLDAMSAITGQNWRRTKIVSSRVGDKSLGKDLMDEAEG